VAFKTADVVETDVAEPVATEGPNPRTPLRYPKSWRTTRVRRSGGATEIVVSVVGRSGIRERRLIVTLLRFGRGQCVLVVRQLLLRVVETLQILILLHLSTPA